MLKFERIFGKTNHCSSHIVIQLINPLYLFFKGLVRAGFWLFYEKSTRIGWKNEQFQGPIILVSNHPSTMMDPLQVAAWAPRHVHFLANYSLFKNPVSNWFLRRLWCIPIQRREDFADARALQNREAFDACDNFLTGGGCLFMCPEGTSFVERKIRPLKTGMARIAFSAEKKANWQLGLTILPFGLTYSAPTKFQGKIWKTMGEPVRVANWRAQFEANERAAVNDLTDFLEKNLCDLTLSTTDDADEKFQRQLETIFSNENPTTDEVKYFQKNKSVWEKKRLDPDLKTGLGDYFEALKLVNLTDRGVSDFLKKRKIAASAIVLALGAPVAAAGGICWFLPCFLPWLVVRFLKPYPGYDPTLKFLMGLFTLPLGGWAIFSVARHFDLSCWQSMGCVVISVIFGLLAWQWWLSALRFWEGLRAQFFFEKEKLAGEKLAAARHSLLEKIGRAD